jgi:AmmeMemoRadiSam system protein A
VTETERARLLDIARAAITAHLMQLPQTSPSASGWAIRAGAFVTLHKHGDLRGCIGHLEPDAPLEETVARCAIAAGTSDPRFPSLTAAELPDVEIEISVLGPLRPVSDPGEIEIGRHGLVVEMNARRGLLLPQVATEWGWDRQTFVAQACRKAGLAPDCVSRGARLWCFEAEVFGEKLRT